MSESDYIDVPNKLFIYTVRLVIYAKACHDVVCIYQALNFLIQTKTGKTPSGVCKPSAFVVVQGVFL